jgi:hypothetical protein
MLDTRKAVVLSGSSNEKVDYVQNIGPKNEEPTHVMLVLN